MGQSSDSLIEARSSNLISKTADWLDNDGADLVGSNNLFKSIEASVFFLLILNLEFVEGILELREFCFWPVEGGQVIRVGLVTAARESGFG